MNTENLSKEGRLIDWLALEAEANGGRVTGASSATALKAIEIIVGQENFAEAVDSYLRTESAAEFIRSVLSISRPWSAMLRCHEAAISSLPAITRARAVELLRSFADRRTLMWIEEYLKDSDAAVRYWAISMIGELIYRRDVSREEVVFLLEMAAMNNDARQREAVADVVLRHFSREEANELRLPIDFSEG